MEEIHPVIRFKAYTSIENTYDIVYIFYDVQ